MIFTLFNLSLNEIYLILQRNKYCLKYKNPISLPSSIQNKLKKYETNKTLWKTFYVDIINETGYNILSSVLPFNLPKTLICNVCKRFPIEFVIYKKNYYTQLVCTECIPNNVKYYLLVEIKKYRKQYEQDKNYLDKLHPYDVIIVDNDGKCHDCEDYTRNMKVIDCDCIVEKTVTFGELFDIRKDANTYDDHLYIEIKTI